ncbi:hypothetical protein TNCV_2989021 [Trichonephila clavipes]|nr:hypothetical protein TNCV_2989021 [Trichonephila clavipes]
MVLLPEEVREKGFLESRSPTFRIDSPGKGMRRTGFEGPDCRQKDESGHVSDMLKNGLKQISQEIIVFNGVFLTSS